MDDTIAAEIGDLTAEAEKMLAGKQPRVGLLRRIGEALVKRTANDPLELPSGDVVSAAAGAWLREHPDAEYLGAELLHLCRVSGGYGMENVVEYDPRKHEAKAIASTRWKELREYFRYHITKPDKAGVLRTISEIWMIRSGKALCIGATASQALLDRIGYEPRQSDGGAAAPTTQLIEESLGSAP